MSSSVLISEIFKSIQGEGPYIGYNQLFIRFSSCNLKCKYCDTDFRSNLKAYTSEELANEVKKYNLIHSISLTGGEPLLFVDFLSDFLLRVNNKIYLETNGTLYDNLSKIIEFIDIVSMDIKLPSASDTNNLFFEHSKFIEISKENNKEIFAKVVFDNNISEEEILSVSDIAEKYDIPIILQPKTDGNVLNISSDFMVDVLNKFLTKCKNVRLIPQMHKFINVK